MATLKELRRRVQRLERDTQALRDQNRALNAEVVKATNSIPPFWVQTPAAYAAREAAKPLVAKAQRASDALAFATSDLVNARAALASHSTPRKKR